MEGRKMKNLRGSKNESARESGECEGTRGVPRKLGRGTRCCKGALLERGGPETV